MQTYEEYTLNEEVINNLKTALLSQWIERYYNNKGIYPTAEEIANANVWNRETYEKYKRVSYARYLAANINEEESGEMIDVAMNFSTIDDDVPTLFGTKGGGNNEEYQYEYWRIVVQGDEQWKSGNFTSLRNVTIRLKLNEYYNFYIYLCKSNSEYNKLGRELITNEFDSSSSILYDYYDTDSETLQINDKEYIGKVLNYQAIPNHNISGTVYTLNPCLKCIINNFGPDRGLLSLEYEHHIDLNSFTPQKETINFWYSNNEIQTDGIGTIAQLSGNSFSYVFSKKERRAWFNGAGSMGFSENFYTGENDDILIETDMSKKNVTIRREGYFVTVTKEGYIPYTNSERDVIFWVYRNEESVTEFTVPPGESEIDTGIDVGIIDD